MRKKTVTPDAGDPLMQSNRTRISDLVSEIKTLYKKERTARSHYTNLVLGQKFLALRKLVTGTLDDFNPKSELGRKWGRFVKERLKGIGISRSKTYACASAWKAATAKVPEAVVERLAHHEQMIGVGVDGAKPFGKYTLAVETALETEPDLESEEGVEAFVELVVGNPEQAAKQDPVKALYVKVIQGLVRIASSKITEDLEGNKRQLTAEMLCDPLYALVSTVQKGIEMKGTVDYETATELPEGYGDWGEVVGRKSELEEIVPKPTASERAAERKRKRVDRDAAKAKAKQLAAAEDITETTPHGYFAKFNRKSRQESQPWEIFLSIDGAKPKLCCRERSRQDAETRCCKLDRIAEEGKRNTPTTTNKEAAM